MRYTFEPPRPDYPAASEGHFLSAAHSVVGTRAVLVAVGLVTALQFVFTYAPFMQGLFDTRPLTVIQGALVVAIAVAGFVVTEAEKTIGRRLSRMSGS